MSVQISDIESVGTESEVQLEGIDFISTGNQYLTFCLGHENYGVEIICVTEIRGWESPTKIPNSPVYMKGVINLRGVIVPIIDLRIMFNVGEASYKDTTVVVVLSLKTDDAKESCVRGFVVDAVSDVLNVDPKEIKRSAAFNGNLPPGFVEGLVNVDASVVTLLNIKELLTQDNEPDD